MKTTLVSAISLFNVIGIDGKLPWKCQDDIDFFKKTIRFHDGCGQIDGCSVLIAGRETAHTLDNLYERSNIIKVSRKDNLYAGRKDGYFRFTVSSMKDAMRVAEDMEFTNCFICGGQSIYYESIINGFIDKAYISVIGIDRFINHDSLLKIKTAIETGNSEGFSSLRFFPMKALNENYKYVNTFEETKDLPVMYYKRKEYKDE